MTFLNPLGFLFALFAVPIILLYMLRLRRRDVLVSSHFLWQRLLQDATANTPWQRLRRNILLLLQLLILALFVLALARPVISVPTETVGRVAVLLDASASMQAIEPDGRSRWELAQAEALNLVAQLGVGDEMTVIRVGDSAQPLVEYTNEASALRNAILGASVGQGGADWNTALTLAVGNTARVDEFNVQIISDGSHGALAQEVIPANIPRPRFIPVGTQRENLAITALAVRQTAGDAPQLFAQVQHFGTATVDFSLALRLDGALWVSQPATIGADAQRAFVFEIDQPFTTVQANLVYGEGVADYLALDNTAWAVSDSNQIRRVLLIAPDESRFLSQVLSSLPNVQLFKGDATLSTLPTQAYDFYVFDRYLPTVLPNADVLFVNPPRTTRLFTLGATVEGIRNIQVVDSAHPLLQYVPFDTLNVRQVRGVETDALQALVTSEQGVILWVGDDNGQQSVLIPFALTDSDFPLHIGFPIFMSNLVDWFSPPNQLTDNPQYRPNASVSFTLPVTADTVRVTTPQNTLVTLTRDQGFAQTDVLGLYTVEALQDAQVLLTQPFAVNLFDPNESNISPLSEVVLSGGEAPAKTLEQQGLREMWGVFASLALVMLLVEWWIYHRQFGLRRRSSG